MSGNKGNNPNNNDDQNNREEERKTPEVNYLHLDPYRPENYDHALRRQ